MVSVKEILHGLKQKALTVCDNVCEQERPSATDSKLKEFVVVSIPVAIHEGVIGAVLDWWVHTTVEFEVYIKDKATSKNPNQMDIPRSDEIMRGLLDIFPFKIEGTDHTYNIFDPTVLYVGRTDNNGYHKTLIQATLTTI